MKEFNDDPNYSTNLRINRELWDAFKASVRHRAADENRDLTLQRRLRELVAQDVGGKLIG